MGFPIGTIGEGAGERGGNRGLKIEGGWGEGLEVQGEGQRGTHARDGGAVMERHVTGWKGEGLFGRRLEGWGRATTGGLRREKFLQGWEGVTWKQIREEAKCEQGTHTVFGIWAH